MAKGATEVKLHDKMVAIERMFQQHGLYESSNTTDSLNVADPAVLIALSGAMERSRTQHATSMASQRQAGPTGD